MQEYRDKIGMATIFSTVQISTSHKYTRHGQFA